jgi:hypothetical protein
MGTGEFFSEGEDHSPVPNAGVKNAWSSTFTSEYAWLLTKYGSNIYYVHYWGNYAIANVHWVGVWVNSTTTWEDTIKKITLCPSWESNRSRPNRVPNNHTPSQFFVCTINHFT